jgi:hypothetical protein
MRARPAVGELALALLFGATGLLWIAGAMDLPFWEGFAPNSGFLPLVYGILLALLSGAIAANLFIAAPAGEKPPPIGKPILLVGVLTVTVVGIGVAGFAAATFLMLVFLYAGLERLALLPSLVAAGATTGALILIFRIWLDVPLPLGPMGI